MSRHRVPSETYDSSEKQLLLLFIYKINENNFLDFSKKLRKYENVTFLKMSRAVCSVAVWRFCNALTNLRAPLNYGPSVVSDLWEAECRNPGEET